MNENHPFNIEDPANWGRPYYWHLEDHIKAIEQMIKADELQIAIEMCDKIPSYYVENYPPELAEIKKILYQQMYDQIDYGTDEEEASWNKEDATAQWASGYCYPRNRVITDLVKGLNDKGTKPWIYDLGCSHGNLPLGLLKEGVFFEYFGRAMNFRASQKIKEWIGPIWKDRPTSGQRTILICTEVAEHCHNIHDIVHSAYKVGVEFDEVVISVPLHCLYGGLPNWKDRRLGHVKGWSQKDLMDFVMKTFPGYSWQYFRYHSQVIHGSRLTNSV